MSGTETERAAQPEPRPLEFQPAQARLEELLGADLARFLIAALLVDGQGRRGSSSP